MKNKIVRIFVVLFSLILLVCPLINLGASAYVPSYSVNFRSNNLPFNNFRIDFYNGTNISTSVDLGTFYPVDVFPGAYIDISSNSSDPTYKTALLYGQLSVPVVTSLADGRYYLFYIFAFEVDVDDRLGVVLNGDVTTLNQDNSATSLTSDGEVIVLTTVIPDTVELQSMTGGLFAPTYSYFVMIPEDEYGVPDCGGSPTECPTLEEQIQDYNGTWAEFQGMMSTNSTLYEDFLELKRTAYNDGIDTGFMDAINSININDDFLSLMDTFLNYGMDNTRDVIDEQLDLVYQNGIDRGIEEGFDSGYTIGYSNGLNKADSNDLIDGFFTDMLNAPINILNGIVIYQISDGGTPLDSSDDINVTVWGVLVTVVIISLFLILLKIFAGG